MLQAQTLYPLVVVGVNHTEQDSLCCCAMVGCQSIFDGHLKSIMCKQMCLEGINIVTRIEAHAFATKPMCIMQQ